MYKFCYFLRLAFLIMLLAPSMGQSQHKNKKGQLVFNPFDFQIIENYVKLNGKIEPSRDTSCASISYLDPSTNLKYNYTSNCQGWRAIRITHHKDRGLDYYLNHQIANPHAVTLDAVIVVTSTNGDLSNQEGITHFLLIIDEIKRELLTPKYFNILYDYLNYSGKEKATLYKNLSIRYKSEDKQQTIEISARPTEMMGQFKPYRIEQKLTRRKSLVKWQYLINEGEETHSDDFFFKHFTDLLVEAKKNTRVVLSKK